MDTAPGSSVAAAAEVAVAAFSPRRSQLHAPSRGGRIDLQADDIDGISQLAEASSDAASNRAGLVESETSSAEGDNQQPELPDDADAAPAIAVADEAQLEGPADAPAASAAPEQVPLHNEYTDPSALQKLLGPCLGGWRLPVTAPTSQCSDCGALLTTTVIPSAVADVADTIAPLPRSGWCGRMAAFIGPGAMVAVGYMVSPRALVVEPFHSLHGLLLSPLP
jgi:hypothetical protein